MFITKFLMFLLGNVAIVSGHMQMKYPPPRRSQFNPTVSSANIDYDMASPLLASGANLSCKKYAPGGTVATFTAGSAITVQMSGSVFHGGGHCQFSISYDDKTFVVVKTIMKNCFTGSGLSIPVTIPAGTPKCDRCTFAWTWVNAIGNREFYMNCADVRIINNSATQRLSGKSYTIANLPGYPVIPEFPPSTYDGSDLYANARIVTVGASTGDGTVGSATPTSPSTLTPRPSISFCATRTVTVIRTVTAGA